MVGPEGRLRRLVRRPARAGGASQALDLIEVDGVRPAGETEGLPGPELRCTPKSERPHAGQAEAEHGPRGVRLPRARLWRRHGEVLRRRPAPTAVVHPAAEHRLGGPCSDRDPLHLRRVVRNGRQVGGVVAIEDRELARVQPERRLQADERAVGGRRDRRFGRRLRRRPRRRGIEPVAALDRDGRVVDRCVDDAHVNGGLARELVAEILHPEDPTGAGGDDRAARLGAPEGDRCAGGWIRRCRCALRRRGCRDARSPAGESDRSRHDAQQDEIQAQSHRLSFPDGIASTTRSGSSSAR
jgi:hypothetical protein